MQEIGETRSAMAKKLSEKLYKIAEDANKDRGLKKFWIVIASKPDMFMPTVIREAPIVTTRKPRPMLSSMCFYVDYTKGIIVPEWILPRDDGTMPFEYEDKGVEIVRNSLNMAGGSKLLL